jgi:hypothetical protein
MDMADDKTLLEKRVDRIEHVIWFQDDSIVINVAATKERTNRIDTTEKVARRAATQATISIIGCVLTVLGMILMIVLKLWK